MITGSQSKRHFVPFDSVPVVSCKRVVSGRVSQYFFIPPCFSLFHPIIVVVIVVVLRRRVLIYPPISCAQVYRSKIHGKR